MNSDQTLPQVPWLPAGRSLPLCDIPWLGRTVVHSTGEVYFCCHSDAVVGNVNDEPLAQIWNNAKMQAVRAALSEGRLPRECQTNDCLVGRDLATDKRLPYSQELQPDGLARQQALSLDMRHRLDVAELSLPGNVWTAGDELAVSLHVSGRLPQFSADVYLALADPQGTWRFLPQGQSYPTPCWPSLSLVGAAPLQLRIPVTEQTPKGDYKLAAALFAQGTPPVHVANCYWSQTVEFRIR